MMQVFWTPVAQSNFEDQISYIAEYNVAAAAHYRRLVSENTQMLERMSQMGRPGRVANTRELVISGTPYIAVYQVASNLIAILRLLHGAQEYPK